MHQPGPSLRNSLPLAVLLAVTLIAYAPSTAALWDFWGHPYLGGHGPLIAAISVWLIVRSRAALASAPAHPSLWGCAGLILCSVASVIFWRASIEELQVLLLPLMLFLAVLAAFGGGVARILAFPLGYLYFAGPMWHVLTRPLQELTVRAVGLIAPLVGMPVRIAGSLLFLPGGVTFEVTPLCSGVNFLVVGLAVAALIGELEQASLRRRAALLASMVLLTVVSNWVRVLIIMAAGYTSGMRNILITSGHLLFGWVLFALVMCGYAWLVGRRSPPAVETSPARSRSAPSSAALAGYVTAVGVLLAMPILARVVPAALSAGVAAPIGLQLPAGRAGWRGPLRASDELWKPHFVGAHSEWHVVYEDSGGDVVDVIVIGYSRQEDGRELVNECNSILGQGTCTDGPTAQPASGLTALTAESVVRGIPHIEVIASDAKGRRFVIWWVYDIGGRKFVTPLFSQLWYGLRSLDGSPYSTLFAYRMACVPSCSAARERLGDFAQTIGTGIVAHGPLD